MGTMEAGTVSLMLGMLATDAAAAAADDDGDYDDVEAPGSPSRGRGIGGGAGRSAAGAGGVYGSVCMQRAGASSPDLGVSGKRITIASVMTKLSAEEAQGLMALAQRLPPDVRDNFLRGLTKLTVGQIRALLTTVEAHTCTRIRTHGEGTSPRHHLRQWRTIPRRV